MSPDPKVGTKEVSMVTVADRYPDLMKSGEMASYLRISRSTLYRLVRSGRLPVARVGGRLRFRTEAVIEMLSAREGPGPCEWPFRCHR